MAEPQNFSDPTAVDVSFGGVAVDGWADGVFLSIETMNDEIASKVGAAGAIGIVRTPNRLRLVKATVLATAPANDMFSAALKRFRTTRSQAVGAVLSIRDGAGTSVVSGKALISKAPAKRYSGAVESNEWALLMVADESNEVIGGNVAW